MSNAIFQDLFLPSNVKPTGLEVKVSAPGKVILHGEHSVVYGRLALAASLGLRTKVKLVEIDAPNIAVIENPDLDFSYTYDLQKIKEYLLHQPLPLSQPPADYNWEYQHLIHHESLVDRVDNFINDTTGMNSLNSTQIVAIRSMLYLVTGILGSVNVELNSFLLICESQLKVGAGTGSSASFLVSVSAALVQYVKMKNESGNFSKDCYKPSSWEIDTKKFNKREMDLICNWSYGAEKIVHGTPSGLDNTICTYGSLVEFRKGLPPKSLPIASPFKILLINTKVSRETKLLVWKVARLHERYPDLVNNILNAMEDVAFAALQNIMALSTLEAIETNDLQNDIGKKYEELGNLSSMNHSLLSALGVSHLKLDEIVHILAQHGLHGKLTGAGGGGFAICLIPPYFEAAVVENAMKVLQSRGFEVICTNLGGIGVTVDGN